MSFMPKLRSSTAFVTVGFALCLAASAGAHDTGTKHVHIAPEDLSHYVFVPNRASADVAIIDTRLDEVIGHAPVGQVPHQVAVSKAHMKMMTSNTADNTVTVTDLSTLEPAGTIELGHEPEHIEMSPDGDLAAIGNIGAGQESCPSFDSNCHVAFQADRARTECAALQIDLAATRLSTRVDRLLDCLGVERHPVARSSKLAYVEDTGRRIRLRE